MSWSSWTSCLCDLWQPTPEKQGILACTPSSGPFLSPPELVTVQPQQRSRPIEFLYTLLPPAAAGRTPPPYGPGQLHHDAASGRSAPSIIEQADARHKERRERQRIEAEARRDKSDAARNKITSAYGSRMLKVGLVQPHLHSIPVTPSRVDHDRDDDDEHIVVLGSPCHMPDYFTEAHAHHSPFGDRYDPPPCQPALSYGTFGTFAAPRANPDSGYPGLGIGFPTGPPVTSKQRRPSRPLSGLTVQVPAVPLESVRRHVAEMLFNIRDGDDNSSHMSAPLTRTDSRYSVESRRSYHSIIADSPTSVRFPGVTVTPAESENVFGIMPMTMPSPNIDTHALTTPATPKIPYTPPALAYPFAHHPSTEPPLAAAAKLRRNSDDTPRQYSLNERPRLAERARSDTPPRGRRNKHRGGHSRRDSLSTHTDDTDDGLVVYKQIGLSGLPRRRRHNLRRKARFEE